MLRLYDCARLRETRAAIEALIGVTSRPAPRASRMRGRARAGGFCRGLDVTLGSTSRPGRRRPLLLAAVLDRFLALHATVNSFVRTRGVLRGRPDAAASWPARAGTRVLL